MSTLTPTPLTQEQLAFAVVMPPPWIRTFASLCKQFPQDFYRHRPLISLDFEVAELRVLSDWLNPQEPYYKMLLQGTWAPGFFGQSQGRSKRAYKAPRTMSHFPMSTTLRESYSEPEMQELAKPRNSPPFLKGKKINLVGPNQEANTSTLMAALISGCSAVMRKEGEDEWERVGLRLRPYQKPTPEMLEKLTREITATISIPAEKFTEVPDMRRSIPSRNVDSSGNRLEGHWYSEQEPYLPRPVAGDPWEGQQKFMDQLAKVEAHSDEVAYRGSSYCRICGLNGNGSREYLRGGWVWPEGYMHYIREHNVRPTIQFQQFIASQSKKV